MSCKLLLDYLAVGLDHAKSTLFIQSQIPELAGVNHVLFELGQRRTRSSQSDCQNRNRTKKKFGESVPTGFFIYPVLKQRYHCIQSESRSCWRGSKPMLRANTGNCTKLQSYIW